MPLYQQQLSIFTSVITFAIPPKPLFSVLTNIPPVTFLICLRSDSLTRGVHGKSEQLMMWDNIHHWN